MTAATILEGRLVLGDAVAGGRMSVANGWIDAVELDPALDKGGPLFAPGFVDVHVHGWGGHDAMGDVGALDGMARALLGRGVTAFLPTAVTAPLDILERFADRVRAWQPAAPADGAEPLGFNLEGPFLSDARRGAHDRNHLVAPADVPDEWIDRIADGLAVTTIAPELPGAADLIERLARRGVAVSLGHSAADLDTSRLGYARGARSTTHLFNGMPDIDHRSPGLAVAALEAEDVFVELIADGNHVHPALWPLMARLKSRDRLMLVSDALSLAGMGDGRIRVGGLEVEVIDGRATLAGTTTLAGSVIALDSAVRNLVAAGIGLPAAVAAASANPAALVGATDRGRIAVGCRADLIELDDALLVGRVMRSGTWLDGDRPG
jgi:N-acetylglucosamine-6-phosphate deacetylase